MYSRRVCVFVITFVFLQEHIWCHYDGITSRNGRNNNDNNADGSNAVATSVNRVTKRENKLLNRKKRYLTFPSGSSFIMTMSLVKSLMIKTPTGLRMVAECDIPFMLPSDTRWLRHIKGNHNRQRREIMDQLSMAIEGWGFNGTACIKRAICDVRAYAPEKGTSLVKDLVMATFKFDEAHEYFNNCDEATLRDCQLPLVNYLEGLTRSEL